MTSLYKKEILELLPHREPMLLIDELHDIKKLSSATAVLHVKKDSFFVQGHFPGQPVMPGVLIVEAFGQAAAALTAHGLDPSTYENKLVFLMIRRPPRSTQGVSSAASDVYKRQLPWTTSYAWCVNC